MKLRFDHLFTGSSWKRNWVLEVDADGDHPCGGHGSPADADVRRVAGIALPGFVNVHSHAFQRALAGFTEYRHDRHDSFWTWRHQMYRLVSRLTPSSCFVIARQLYLEMVRAGYTTVGEFHYVHRDTEGSTVRRSVGDVGRLDSGGVGHGHPHLPAAGVVSAGRLRRRPGAGGSTSVRLDGVTITAT